MIEFNDFLLDPACATCLIFSLSIVKSDSSDELNLETFVANAADNSQMLLRAFVNPSYVAAVKAFLPFLDERGFLDALIVEE